MDVKAKLLAFIITMFTSCNKIYNKNSDNVKATTDTIEYILNQNAIDRILML